MILKIEIIANKIRTKFGTRWDWERDCYQRTASRNGQTDVRRGWGRGREGLPKTRNAKVLRRMVRAGYLDQERGNTSSLVNPQAMEEIKKAK